jgi:hypothetical protein
MADYSAWLIEIAEASGNRYFQMSDDDDWTPDHNKALHLSRKQDAESIIAYYGWTRAKASEHLWPEPVSRIVVDESNGHHWIIFGGNAGMHCCRDCGLVRRADDQNSPCKGAVSVGPRSLPSHERNDA